MNTLDISDVVDRSRLNAANGLVIGLCALCMVIDGLDVQAMGYVAPSLLGHWGIEKAALGPVFGAGLVGMAIGALGLGTLADRIGRRPVLIGALLLVAACMAATAQATSIRELLLLRFATGLGMGAIIPSAVALAGEFSPARHRVTLMMMISCGFILGGAAGGAIAALIIPAWGWPMVFIAGAGATLLLALTMLVALPESLQFLVLQGREAKARRWLARLDPTLAIGPATRLLLRDQRKKGLGAAHLFRDSLGTGTVLLWMLNFMNLLGSYFLANWLPVIVGEAGHGATEALLSGTLFWVGGISGNLLLGWFVDRRGFGLTLAVTFGAAALSIAAIGQVAASLPLVCVAIAAAGFCILGAQAALNALAAVYYPASLRSTGVGWTLGIGRLGSIVGPVIGGELMRLHWGTADLFFIASMPAAFALIALLVFWRSGRLPKPAARDAITPRFAGASLAAEPRV